MEAGNGERRSNRAGAFGLPLCLAALLLAGCSDKLVLQRAFRPNLVIEHDTSLMDDNQLNDAIAEQLSRAEAAKYRDAAMEGLKASANVGAFRLVLAERYLGKKMYRDAYDVLVLASQSFPDDWRIYYNAGTASAFVAKSLDIKGPRGREEQASWYATSEAAYKRALRINTRSSETKYGLAVLYAFELGRIDEAIGLLTELLAVETKDVDAMLVLARCYAVAGRLEDAANWYQAAAEATVVPEKRQSAEENRAKVLEQLGGGGNGR